MAGGYSEGTVRTRRLLPEKYGITPRAIRHIFNKKIELEAAATVEVSAYFVEIYNNKLRDLFRRLNIKEKEDKKTKQTDYEKTMTIPSYNEKTKEVEIKNATILSVASAEELLELFESACANRIVAKTQLNPESSRSHSILGIIVKTSSSTSSTTVRGKLSLIDLAGSERVGKTGVTGDQLKEGIEINKSLSTLSKVVRLSGAKDGFLYNLQPNKGQKTAGDRELQNKFTNKDIEEMINCHLPYQAG